MTAFLAWIYDQATKVYDWFSDRYWSFVYSLSIVWDWVTHQIDIARKAIEAWVKSITDGISAWAQGWFDWLLSKINEVIQWLNSTIAWYRDWVNGLISTVYNWVSSFVADQVKVITDWVTGGLNYIGTQLTGYINSLRDSVYKDIGNLLSLYSQVSKLICLTDDNVLSRILHLVTDGFTTLQAFIANPLGFVFGILEAQFIHFLADQLGAALGTVQADLPNKQDYTHQG